VSDMNMALVNRLAVREHDCPVCGQPAGTRCREEIAELGYARWRVLTQAHAARAGLVDGEEPVTL